MPPAPSVPLVHEEAKVVLPVEMEAEEVAKPFPKPIEGGVHSEVVVPQVKGEIEVVAARPGFYNHSRRVEGDVFTVPSMEKVGNWMKCTDPVLEKQHQEMMKKAKRKAMEKQQAEL